MNTNIFRRHDWYIHLEPEINQYFIEYNIQKNKLSIQDFENLKTKREKFIEKVESHLDLIKKNLVQDIEGVFDTDRKIIDTIVIHHTSRHWRTSISKIETIHLLNLYVREFLTDPKLRGKKLFSGHVYNKQQTFFAYHYIIFNDGSYINPLKDEYIGWHCGNHDYNTRSIAISIHDDLYEKFPNKNVIKTLKLLIQKYKIKYNSDNIRILGHREIKPTTDCPGNKFLGNNGWKNLLL